jgi:thiol-disulfide isomerase/thioredoxin
MDFWATWCGPCKTEGKLLEQVMQNFRKEPHVIFLAVNVDEERDSVPRFIKEEAWTVPVVYGKGLDQLLGVRALPTLVIFDQSGRVVFRQEGLEPGMFVETLERKLGEVLRPRISS